VRPTEISLFHFDGRSGCENGTSTGAAFYRQYENAQEAEICHTEHYFGPAHPCSYLVSGLIHKSNAAGNVTGYGITFYKPGNLTLEVTIVVRLCDENSPLAEAPNDIVTPCNPAESIYYYSAFNLNVVVSPEDLRNSMRATSDATIAPVHRGSTMIRLLVAASVAVVTVLFFSP
jgi:hypothetical protein